MRLNRTAWMVCVGTLSLLLGAPAAAADEGGEAEEEQEEPPACIEETSEGETQIHMGACVGIARTALHEVSGCNVNFQPAEQPMSAGRPGADGLTSASSSRSVC